jgi:hypothetical protein
MDMMSDTFVKHFIYTEAKEGKALLDRTIETHPDLNYTVNINTHPEIGLIKVEIDLSFLDISEQSMTMLGLTFDEPLHINVSVSEVKLL